MDSPQFSHSPARPRPQHTLNPPLPHLQLTKGSSQPAVDACTYLRVPVHGPIPEVYLVMNAQVLGSQYLPRTCRLYTSMPISSEAGFLDWHITWLSFVVSMVGRRAGSVEHATHLRVLWPCEQQRTICSETWSYPDGIRHKERSIRDPALGRCWQP